MNETLGQRIQLLRKNKKLTQEELAEKLNVTAQAVSKWENDLSAPDISLLIPLSELFNVSIDELLGKAKQETKVLSENERKDINKLIFKISVLSSDGDDVKVNIPLVLAKIFVESGKEMPKINNKDFLSNIDMEQIIMLAENGMMGELLSVNSSDGDIIKIYVE